MEAVAAVKPSVSLPTQRTPTRRGDSPEGNSQVLTPERAGWSQQPHTHTSLEWSYLLCLLTDPENIPEASYPTCSPMQPLPLHWQELKRSNKESIPRGSCPAESSRAELYREMTAIEPVMTTRRRAQGPRGPEARHGNAVNVALKYDDWLILSS